MQTDQLDSIISKTNQKGNTKGHTCLYRFFETKNCLLSFKNSLHKKSSAVVTESIV